MGPERRPGQAGPPGNFFLGGAKQLFLGRSASSCWRKSGREVNGLFRTCGFAFPPPLCPVVRGSPGRSLGTIITIITLLTPRPPASVLLRKEHGNFAFSPRECAGGWGRSGKAEHLGYPQKRGRSGRFGGFDGLAAVERGAGPGPWEAAAGFGRSQLRLGAGLCGAGAAASPSPFPEGFRLLKLLEHQTNASTNEGCAVRDPRQRPPRPTATEPSRAGSVQHPKQRNDRYQLRRAPPRQSGPAQPLPAAKPGTAPRCGWVGFTLFWFYLYLYSYRRFPVPPFPAA